MAIYALLTAHEPKTCTEASLMTREIFAAFPSGKQKKSATAVRKVFGRQPTIFFFGQKMVTP